jgi:hypothetical protein
MVLLRWLTFYGQQERNPDAEKLERAPWQDQYVLTWQGNGRAIVRRKHSMFRRTKSATAKS